MFLVPHCPSRSEAEVVFDVQKSLLIISIVSFGIGKESIATVAVLVLREGNFLADFLILQVVFEFGLADGGGAVELGSGFPEGGRCIGGLILLKRSGIDVVEGIVVRRSGGRGLFFMGGVVPECWLWWFGGFNAGGEALREGIYLLEL